MASPSPSPGILGLAIDVTGFLVSVLIAWPPMPRVWRLHHIADIGLARRCQCWFLALLLHSITAIMIVIKEFLPVLKEWKKSISTYTGCLHLASLLVKFLGPLFILIVSIILLARLVKHYPITQDILITRFIVGYVCLGYLSILFTDFMCSDVTLILELILIPVIICTHAFRFTAQGPLVRFEKAPLIFSLLGAIPGVLCLIPLAGEAFLEHLLKRLALKIATLAAAIFRGFDIITISCPATREAVNYFRSRLQEWRMSDGPCSSDQLKLKVTTC